MVTSREWHAKNRDKSRALAKEWRAKNAAKRKAYSHKYRAENRDKIRAREAVKRALRKGVLRKPDNCQRCGNLARVQAHHHDYAKQLDVEWICQGCHGKEHRRAA